MHGLTGHTSDGDGGFVDDDAEASKGGAAETVPTVMEEQYRSAFYRQARSELRRRLSAAEMLKTEGNDMFVAGKFVAALNEYEYAVQLFAHEMANLDRDQEGAGLGAQGRGLSSDDLPRIQGVRVPCLLNAAACHIKIGGADHLVKALERCADVARGAAVPAQRAKAFFRMGQAHHALQNHREAWDALLQAQMLDPSSREVRALQKAVSLALKQLKGAERESREGLLTTDAHERQLSKEAQATAAANLRMLRRLLPAHGSAEANAFASTCGLTNSRAEELLRRTATSGWVNLSDEDRASLSAVWAASSQILTEDEVADGRAAGLYPPPEEERVFGTNLAGALRAHPFPKALAWLAPDQRRRAQGLATTLWRKGVRSLDHGERRLCEGLQLLAMTPHTAPWHKRALDGGGGAQLILAPSRAHLWRDTTPVSLRVQTAIMGAHPPADERARIDSWSRRPMSAGEIGIIESNATCWEHALHEGWEWTLILEDDADVRLDGGALQLLALLPALVASAAQQEGDWQLIALSPHGLEPFYMLCDPSHIPSLIGPTTPEWAKRPHVLGETGWKRIGPTFHAFGWIYRRPLLEKLLDARRLQAPPLNPIDVWVWEVMAHHGMLGLALAPTVPLVTTRDAPGGPTSVRTTQR